MNERRRPIATSTMMMIAILAAGLLPNADAWATESTEVQELRREIRQVRAEAQVLQSALVEAAELEQQRSAKLARALNADATSSQPAALSSDVLPPTEVAVTETRSPTTQSSPSSGGVEKRRSKRHRRHRRAR